jgi:hypothetical protein
VTVADGLSERMGVCPPDREERWAEAVIADVISGDDKDHWEGLVASPVPFALVVSPSRILRKRRLV